MMPQWVVHRDSRFWDEPETFDPSRWDGETDRNTPTPLQWGPRHCVGMRFASLELRPALATMIGRTNLDVSIDKPLSFTPSVSSRPETDVTATVRRE